VKGNQGTLLEDVRTFLDEQRACAFRDTPATTCRTFDEGGIRTRGRV
jgi:hypothetical protein